MTADAQKLLLGVSAAFWWAAIHLGLQLSKPIQFTSLERTQPCRNVQYTPTPSEIQSEWHAPGKECLADFRPKTVFSSLLRQSGRAISPGLQA